MAIDLNKQLGPFPLKIWLVIGAGGIGAGLYLAKHNLSAGATALSDTAKASNTIATPQSSHSGYDTPPGFGLQQTLATITNNISSLQGLTGALQSQTNNIGAEADAFSGIIGQRDISLDNALHARDVLIGQLQQQTQQLGAKAPQGITSTV